MRAPDTSAESCEDSHRVGTALRGLAATAGIVAVVVIAALVALQLAAAVGLFAGAAETGGTAAAVPGDKIWEFDTGDDITMSSPTIVNGTVYIGSTNETLYAVNATDGSLKWKYQTSDNEYPYSDSVETSPTVVDGVVYFGADTGRVYALHAANGSLKWTHKTDRAVDSSPTVAGDTVYVGGRDDYVYALRTSDGSVRWKYKTGQDVTSSPTVVDGTVYVGSRDENFYALNASDGSAEWVYTNTSSDVDASPTVVDGVIYIGGRDILHAIYASNGSQKWTYDAEYEGVSSPTVKDDTVYIAVEGGEMHAINATDSKIKWISDVESLGKSSPTIAEGVVYIGTYGGENILALDASDGTRQWDYQAEDNIQSSPTVADGVVYVGSRDNKLYALEASYSGSYSGGSRVMLGTLGHHNRFIADGSPYGELGEAYIIEGSEQPADGTAVDPREDVELAIDVQVEGSATVEFYEYESGDPANDPFIGDQSVGSGRTTASTRWDSEDRDASEEWYVVLKDSTGTRDTAGAFAFGAGGQVVARDAETGDIIDDRTVRFDATYPGGSETFDRTPGTLNLSQVNSEPGDRIRIDIRAQNYYEATVEVPNEQTDEDIYLERGNNWSANPSNDDPENTAGVEDDPDRYLSRFELEDRTGRYPPSNTTLSLRADVDDDGETDLVHSSTFGAANRVGAHVKQDRQYQLIIENDQGDRRRLGAWTALGEPLVKLQVRAFDFNIPDQGAGWASHASVEETDNDTELLRWQFSDPDEATSRLEVAIYERDNRSNGLLNQTYSDLGNASYTQQLTGNQTGKAWVVELNGTRNGEIFTSREIVGATDLAPGIPLDPFYQEMFAVLLLLVLAGVFGGIRAETGAIIVPMTAAVLFWMGWLPGVVTASAIAAALFVAVLYRIRSTPQPGVR